MNRWDGVNNESVNERCSMSRLGSGVGYGVVEWVKRSTLRRFGHIERVENEEFVKKVYLSSVEGSNRRGRQLGRWEDRVKEYVSERGVRRNGLEWARRECMDREVENRMPWLPPVETFPEGVRHQSYRWIDR